MRHRIMRAAPGPTNKARRQLPAPSCTRRCIAPEAPSRLRASRVTFTPGGRTNWHTHAVGQVLYVLSGVGRYQMLGEAVQRAAARRHRGHTAQRSSTGTAPRPTT